MRGLTDEQIWDDLGMLPEGELTLADLWDRARLWGISPSALFPFYRSSAHHPLSA